MKNDLSAYYDQGYHGKIHANLMDNEDYYWARARAFHQLYFCGDELAHAKVLDYGCGLGQASACLKNVTGYDASAEARQISRKMGLTVVDAPEEIPEGLFNKVICRHVLEHVPNPEEVLKNFSRYLKKDGELILVLPKETHRSASLEADDHMHLYAWNFRTINNLLSICGFRATANKELFHWGFSKLLPLRKIFGESLYLKAAILVGHLTRTSELVIIARKV